MSTHEDEAREIRLAIDHVSSRLPTERIDFKKLRKGWLAFQNGLMVYSGALKGLPFKPFPYQSKAFDSFFLHDKTALQWSRQTGKTISTGAYVVYLAKQVPGLTALVASFRHEQSVLLVDSVYGWSKWHSDPSYQANLPRRRAQTHVYFENGSKLFAVPHGEASMGRTLDLLIFDESQEIPDEDLRASSPTTAASGGRRIWIGTSFVPEGFWYEITQAPRKHGFNLIRVPYTDALAPNGPVTVEAIEADRLLLSPAQFKMNYELVAIAGVNRFFERESVLGCKISGPESLAANAFWLAGHDHAITRDESVVIVGGLVDGVWSQRQVLSFPRGMPLDHQARRTLEVLPPECLLVVDSTGESGVQMLAEYGKLGVNVHGFDYAKGEAKQHLMSQLWQWIQNRKIRLYDQITIDQLIDFRYHLSSTGREIYGDSSHADDRVNALALAIEGAAQNRSDENKYPALFVGDGANNYEPTAEEINSIAISGPIPAGDAIRSIMNQ